MRHARQRCAPGLAGLPLAQQIELAVGPGRISAFASEDERRCAWERHRRELLSLEPPGRRPWAWWFYDKRLLGTNLQGAPVVERLQGLTDAHAETREGPAGR